MANLSLQHIYKIYQGDVAAVKDFNLEIEDKEFIVFIFIYWLFPGVGIDKLVVYILFHQDHIVYCVCILLMANLFCLFQKDSLWKLFFCYSEHMFYFNYIFHINKKVLDLLRSHTFPFSQVLVYIYIMLWVKSLCGFFTLNITKVRLIYQ